jgi:hypothetical protein
VSGNLELEILPQPDDLTCGPTCLHAVYRYYGDDASLATLIEEVRALQGGGTLAVLLGCHALRRGYRSILYTCNLRVLDPTWFGTPPTDLVAKLGERRESVTNDKQRFAIDAYLDYLGLGGELRWTGFTARLLRRHLARGEPILTGLSATYLYQCPRERGEASRMVYDDVRGDPAGHFVVLAGYEREARTVRIADPYRPNPMATGHYYDVELERLVAAIYLGILTYDANLLVLRPAHRRR